ncbi:MAG: hypothetical protein LBJ00_16350 [Planctomycetaceae bacterium]|nr:hypothetical protein [Planctomycetaceae bacterium]
MKTKTKLLLNTIVLVALVTSAIGCRMNGNGPWYYPTSYSPINPFRIEDHNRNTAPAVADNSQLAKPHMDSRVDIKQPEGGYNEQRRDATMVTRSGNGELAGPDVLQSYHQTGYHQQHTASGVPTTPTSAYGGTPTTYSGYGNNNVMPPITQSDYSQPSGQPNGFNQPSGYQQPPAMVPEAKNDMTYPSIPYAASTSPASAGYPSTATYPSTGAGGGYSPSPQDNGNYSTSVSSPFASPTGQPVNSALPPNAYGSSNPNVDPMYGGNSAAVGATSYGGGSNPVGHSPYTANGISATGGVYASPSTL